MKDKKISPSMSKYRKDAYEKLDMVLISDGGIANVEEVIGYFMDISRESRVYVIAVGNDKFAEEVDAIYPIAADYVDGVETINDRMILAGLLSLVQDLYKRVEELEAK